VLAGDGDVGGLLGIHLREEMHWPARSVSVDGLELKDFDYIDIGAMMPDSGRGGRGDQVAGVSDLCGRGPRLARGTGSARGKPHNREMLSRT
jgi:hypothetical protein